MGTTSEFQQHYFTATSQAVEAPLRCTAIWGGLSLSLPGVTTQVSDVSFVTRARVRT
jgi:hypothetical protein